MSESAIQQSAFNARAPFPRHSAAKVFAAGLALVTAAPFANAQLVLEEIVVTAQKRTEAAIDVPISMAVETGESLEKKGILDLQTLSINTPGLYLQDGGRTSQVAMRGLGSPGLDSVESSVGFYIDGIYFGRSRLSRNPLFDMERIEVLRGPQGVLYGRNTIAGAINMLTNKPTEDFEGRILVEGGSSVDNHKIEAYVSGPIVGGLSGRLSVLDSRRGSYLNNSAAGPNGGGQDTEGFRGSLRWSNDAVDVTFKYEQMEHANLGSYAQLSGNPFDAPALRGLAVDTEINDIQQVSGQGINDLGNKVGGFFTSDSGSLNLTWDVTDNLRLTSVTGAYEYEAESRDYITASPVDTLTIAGLTDRYEYWSQEFRLESTGDGPFNFIVGASVDNYQLTTLPNTGQRAVLNLGGPVTGGFQDGLAGAFIPAFGALGQSLADQFAAGLADGFTLVTPGGSPDGSVSNLTQDIDTFSVFVAGTYEFNDQWHLSLGVRYTDEENTSTFAKGTYYTNGIGEPWGTLPNGAELAASAVANDPALLGLPGGEATLTAIYQGTLDTDIGGGLLVSQLPFVIAAPGGTPLARPDPITEDSVTPSLKVQYFANDNAMFYLSAVTGFKAAGFNSSNILPFTVAGDTFQSEEALAFELGGKFTLGGGAGTLTAAIFRTDFDDLQVGTITAQGASSVVNAASAITQGLELDTVWRLTEEITIGGSYSYLDAHYTDSVDLNCNGFQTATRVAAGESFDAALGEAPCTYRLDQQFSGNDNLQRAPEHTASAFLQHDTSFGGSWNLQSYLGLNYRDEANTSIENILRSDSTFLVNARVALYNEPGQWSVAVYGNNLTDDDGLILRQDNSGSAEKGIITTPRTWAVQFTKSF